MTKLFSSFYARKKRKKCVCVCVCSCVLFPSLNLLCDILIFGWLSILRHRRFLSHPRRINVRRVKSALEWRMPRTAVFRPPVCLSTEMNAKSTRRLVSERKYRSEWRRAARRTTKPERQLHDYQKPSHSRRITIDRKSINEWRTKAEGEWKS